MKQEDKEKIADVTAQNERLREDILRIKEETIRLNKKIAKLKKAKAVRLN